MRAQPRESLRPNWPGARGRAVPVLAGIQSVDELARRAGTRQSVISAIENGAQAPGGIMLARIAHALGGTLSIHIAA